MFALAGRRFIRRRLALAATALTAIALLAAAVAVAGTFSMRIVYPATKRIISIDSYFGERVVDAYRWLENPSDPAVETWANAQSHLATTYVEGGPFYSALSKRIVALNEKRHYIFALEIHGNRLFSGDYASTDSQPKLVVREGLHSSARVLYDPASATIRGVEPSIETVAVAVDGRKVAFTTQLGGAQDETLHVLDVDTGKMLADTLLHVGGVHSPVAIAWDADDNGFLHTRWPRSPNGTYATSAIEIYHHTIGTDPANDTYVFGRGLTKNSEFVLQTSVDGTVTAAIVSDGDGVRSSVYLRRGAGPFARVASPNAGIGGSEEIGDGANHDGAFVGDSYYAIARKRASLGEIVALVPGGTFETAKIVVPASNVVIGSVVPLDSGFITVDYDAGDFTARSFATDGTFRFQLPIPSVAGGGVAASATGGPVVLFPQTPTADTTYLAYDPSTNAVTKLHLVEASHIDFSNIALTRVFVPSLDGKVKIPLEIVYAKNAKRDGTAPTILTAYGAYGTVYAPSFDPWRLAWLEGGRVMAYARVRGGGEYGNSWHLAAHLAGKTRSSDDLAACAIWLGKNGYGSARHLGIFGASGGGFLMGLALTRNPSLYRAVVSDYGIYDLLHWELTPNGAYNTGEFGTVKDPAQFAWMREQSPYNNVRKGVAYPAVLLKTGENDPRVEPYNSRKMIAALQAASSSPYAELLIQRSGQGHGSGDSTAQLVRETADQYAFFQRELR